ncbi:MAG: hypothetical protein ACI88A_000775 [Paraglaciecola sp.]|jgi:hypothetical protein
MFMLFIMLVAAIVTISMNKTRLVKTLMDVAGTLFCYIGVIVFIALTCSQAVRRNFNKTTL